MAPEVQAPQHSAALAESVVRRRQALERAPLLVVRAETAELQRVVLVVSLVTVVPQQLLHLRQPQPPAAVEGTVVHPPQEPPQPAALVDRLQRHLQLGPPQPVVAVETAVTAPIVLALSVAQEAQHWSTAPQAALQRAETAGPAAVAPPPVQLVQLVVSQLLSVVEPRYRDHRDLPVFDVK